MCFPELKLLSQASSVRAQEKELQLAVFYYQHWSDFVLKWPKCDVKKGSCLVVHASSQHCGSAGGLLRVSDDSSGAAALGLFQYLCVGGLFWERVFEIFCQN